MKYTRLKQLSDAQLVVENSYFDLLFWSELEANPFRVRIYERLENELSQLDDNSWARLKEDLLSLCLLSHPEREWVKLFEKLNEAKGYCFLKKLGCKDIEFIARSKIRTPDLRGNLNGTDYFCEVKTINVSDYKIDAIKLIKATEVTKNISSGLEKKLKKIFKSASIQLNNYAEIGIKFIYLIINYDHNLAHVDVYNAQVHTIYNQLNISNIILKIHDEKIHAQIF